MQAGAWWWWWGVRVCRCAPAPPRPQPRTCACVGARLQQARRAAVHAQQHQLRLRQAGVAAQHLQHVTAHLPRGTPRRATARIERVTLSGEESMRSMDVCMWRMLDCLACASACAAARPACLPCAGAPQSAWPQQQQSRTGQGQAEPCMHACGQHASAAQRMSPTHTPCWHRPHGRQRRAPAAGSRTRSPAMTGRQAMR